MVLIEGVSKGERVRPLPHAVKLPVAHFLSALPFLASARATFNGSPPLGSVAGSRVTHPTSSRQRIPPRPPQHGQWPASSSAPHPAARPPSQVPPECGCRFVQIEGHPSPSPFPVCMHRTQLPGGLLILSLIINPGKQKGGLTGHRGI